jgi:membrane-bound serine protease (ClpP class)
MRRSISKGSGRADRAGDRLSRRSFRQVAALVPVFFLLASLATLCLAGSALGEASVMIVALEGDITPASDDIVVEAILQAELEGCEAIVITLDTPGGGLTETKEITGQIERTSLPVIGYVYPSGATAWSAGTIILLSSDIAAMVPVSIGPTGTEPVNDTKVINAVVALAEEKARVHGRNTTAAREFVLSNLNLNAEDALEFGVIELVSPNLEALMEELDGMEAKNRTLATSGAEIVRFEPSFGLKVLAVLSDPLLAGLLLIVGLYALIFGLSNPGLGAELVGVITLALGLIGLGFSVNLGALFLIILGLVLLLVELNSPGFGLMGAAGLACMIVGSILLVPIGSTDWYTPAEYKMDAFVALIVPSLVIGGFFVFALYKVAEARRRPTYSEVMNQEVAEALDRIDPKGHVMYNGEYWAAESTEPIEAGEIVEVVGKKRMVLKVRRKK